jgi:signal transduction histidine kinase
MPELIFTVDSALLSEIGEKLVETAHIALVELVKNAYDADANQITVRILPKETGGKKAGGPEIHVIDDGSGMTFEDVQRYWMKIATTHKRAIDVSPIYGRPRAGSKGIGRFSCRRLGGYLKLMTVAKIDGGLEETVVTFDWLSFTPGTDISTIICEGERKKVSGKTTGTTLIISGSPVDEWKKRGYDFLKRQLAVLAANRGAKRRGFIEDPGFNIALDAPGFGETISNLRDSLLSAGWGDLTVEVARDGTATCKLDALKVGTKTVKYPTKVPNLVGVSARIAIMPGQWVEMRNRGVLSQGSRRDILEQWGGVYIRYKGFRVYPYGDPGNDWLNIDRDRALRKASLSDLLQPFAAKLQGVNPTRALLSLFSAKSYIGDIEIDNRATGFEMKASREGFVGEFAVASLRELIRFAIDWSTIYYEYSKHRAAKEEARQAVAELEEHIKSPILPEQVVSSAVRVVQSEVRQLATQLPTAERQHVLRSLKTATQAIEKHEAFSRQELKHLRLVASTSTLLLIFSHEVKSLLSWLEQVSITIDQVRRNVPASEAKKLAGVRDEFRSNKDRFIDLLGMTSLISVDSRKQEPGTLTLRPRLERAKRCFALITTTYEIDVDIDEVPGSLQIGHILEAELFAILLNVLSNAIKSVIAAGGRKRVKVTTERRGTKKVIIVRDSGLGLDESRFEEVFSPFVADPDDRLYKGLTSRLNPEDRYIVGTGSGLGLSIVREIVSNRNGSVNFVKSSEHWKATLEIILP